MTNEVNDHYLHGKLQPEITIIMFVPSFVSMGSFKWIVSTIVHLELLNWRTLASCTLLPAVSDWKVSSVTYLTTHSKIAFIWDFVGGYLSDPVTDPALLKHKAANSKVGNANPLFGQ